VSEPSVSVVLPVRDGERFLGEAMESVLGQTLADLELIVVDDGSSDGSLDLAREFGDERVRVLRQDRLGLVEALNRGLREARAQYVARMDADDVSETARFERQVELLERSPRAAMAGSWCTVVDTEGRELRQEVLPCRHDDLVRRLLLRNPFQHGSVMLRRDAVERVGGYRPDYGPNEDYDLWRRLARAFELASVPAALYRYRLHPQAVTRTDPDRVRVRERLRDEIWHDFADESYSVRGVLGSARTYRKLDRRVFRDHVADQRAFVREALQRRRPRLAARALTASVALSL
jgi:glycosyltransferase involved in cell wall biosynthesis